LLKFCEARCHTVAYPKLEQWVANRFEEPFVDSASILVAIGEHLLMC
jgi:hypothetical protein